MWDRLSSLSTGWKAGPTSFRRFTPTVVRSIIVAMGILSLEKALMAMEVMKLQSFRDIDRVHVRDLVSIGLVDDALAEQLPPDLLSRLEELRSNLDG